MIAMKILDVRTFMSELLVHQMFDPFLLSELEINTSIYYQVSGKLNLEFYSDDELEILQGRKYSLWKDVKPVAFSLIKGNKLPLSMKIVFMVTPQSIESIVEKSNVSLNASDVNGLYLNLKYEKGELILTTGTSIKIFTLDKSLDQLWDERVIAFFKQKKITIENA